MCDLFKVLEIGQKICDNNKRKYRPFWARKEDFTVMSKNKNSNKLNAEEFGASLQLGVKKSADAAKTAVKKISTKVKEVVSSIAPESKPVEEASEFVEPVEGIPAETAFEPEREPKNIVEEFFMQFIAHFKKDCLSPDGKDVVSKKNALIAIGASAGALIVIVAAVLLILTYGITPHTGITVDEFIDSYNSIPETVSGTDAMYTITTYLPEYEDIKIPEDASLKGGKTISLYDGHIEISAKLKGNNIVRLEIYGVDFPNFDPEQDTFVGLENGDYSYLYYYIALGKALAIVQGSESVYDVYAAASYGFTYQSYAVYYKSYGLGNIYSSTYEIDGRVVSAGYDLDKDCLFIEAVEEPILNWSGKTAEQQ